MTSRFQTLHPTRGFYGWSVLAVTAFAIFMSGPGQTYGISVFIDPLIEDTGWSRSLVSTLYSVATLFGAGVILIVGRTVDSRGSRSIMLLAALLFGIGLLLASIVNHAALLLVAFALMRAFGSGSLTLSSRTLVPFWFVRNRGRAFSIVGLASALSLAFFPPFGNFLVNQLGWRSAWRVEALMVFAFLIPAIYLVIRNRPEEVGQSADGEVHTSEASRLASMPVEEHSWTLHEAMRHRTFWLLIGAGIVPALVITGLSFNQVSILTDRGFSSGIAATTFTIESAVAAPMTLISGWLADRAKPRYLLAGSQALLAVALVVLLLSDSIALVALYAIVRGVSSGLWIVAADVVWPGYFGRRHLGSIRGVTFAVGITGAAIGPIPLSFAFDITGSYEGAIAGLLVLPILGTIAILMAKPPSHPSLQTADNLESA